MQRALTDEPSGWMRCEAQRVSLYRWVNQVGPEGAALRAFCVGGGDSRGRAVGGG